MTFIRRFIALILLLAWVPASSHCLLAAALQDAVVDCCVEAKQQSGGESHHDSGCCPFCGTFESGKYLTSTMVEVRYLPDSNVPQNGQQPESWCDSPPDCCFASTQQSTTASCSAAANRQCEDAGTQASSRIKAMKRRINVTR